MTSAEAIKKLDKAKTIDKLVAIWNAIPIDLKQVEEVIAKKDSLKETLNTK